MSGAYDFSSSVFRRAQETPDDVLITRPVAETQGLQPEDLGVLMYVGLLPPAARVTGKGMAAGMRALGWDMPDERFEEIAKRLTKAGYLTEVAQ
ncbi:hypothetical protein CFC35_41645 [Streptomyces sp. FBKL.4005]|uniref:hypothetical protein n=1 Tax=Streptomyces sp. FBKL.4005 TaxID=2015515 RepID=UPI000B96544E|nr:hypothetical protein [Streptomyces sp. FBKL.4005]OYP10146.1 hypothetical protein CFC35_41645 [Streptomyces sp. FBKL.4005]